jgi:predicted NAD/FAD-dependent oxidoreductase
MVVKARNLLAGGMVAGLLALAGCNSGSSGVAGLLETAQAPCPRVGVIADAADLTRFRAGGGTDLTAMVVDARVSGFQAKCNYAPRREGLVVTLTPAFSAERGPAASGSEIEIPYMVAVVSEDDRILSQASYNLRVAFPPNVARVQSGGEELSITLPGGVQQAASRRVLIGFQLSPEELAANRRRGPR